MWARSQRRNLRAKLSHRSLGLRRVSIGIAVCAFASPLFGEEVQIGHLETSDDTGINWLHFRCNTSGDKALMHCQIFQTLISKKRTEAQVNTELKKMEGMDLLAEFQKDKELGAGCKSIIENASKIEQTLSSGLGVDGKLLKMTPEEIAFMRSFIEACSHPTKDNLWQLFSYGTKRDLRTCVVDSRYWHRDFTWIPQTRAWVSQEGPTGPCGTNVVRTLSAEDPNRSLSLSLWHYVEKSFWTNPNGNLVDKDACSSSPEYTLNYTWRIKTTMEGCDYIESTFGNYYSSNAPIAPSP